MKNLFAAFFIFLSFVITSFAQIVITEPEFPTQYDSIVVLFDATQPGAEGLLNYTGTVYAHTGVTTNLGQWQHVVGSWGNNTNQPALTRLGVNSYKLTIGYPRTFYSVTSGSENITQLSMVFRSADGTKQTNPDIFIDLYEPGINLIIQNPVVSVQFDDPLRSPAFVQQGETIQIVVNAVALGTTVSNLKMLVDGNEVAQTSENTIYYDFVHSNFTIGAHTVSIIGTPATGNSDTTSFVMFCNPEINYSSLTNGLRPGINYTSTTTATLALFAPHKSFVYLIGDFNDWKVSTDYFMNCDSVSADSVIWWMDLTLSAGLEYAFQYLVDGKIRIADPYSEKVLDPWNDPYIPSTHYPNLKTYPSVKTENIVGIVQTSQPAYQWQVTDFQKPDKEKLVIYELLVRDFSTLQSYQFLIDTLSYLKSLGVNAIELMPVNEFEGNSSWGYNVSFHIAQDKYYGTPNKLKEFIDICHQNGIAVIFDMVLNHAYGLSPLVRLYWDANNNRPAANSPWFNVTSPNPIFSFGYDFNHEKNATKYFVDRVNRYWLEEFKFDGFRFDFTKGFTNTPGDGGAYDQPRINILKRMADQVWAYDSTAYVILEHFAANSEEIVLSNYGMMLWGNHNFDYNEATMGYTSNFSGISYLNRGWTKPHLVGYMESHDEERLMVKNLAFGNSSGSYSTKNFNVALNRMKLAAAFFLTVPGPKMIWQFGELGYDIGINFNGRTGEKPVKWDYLNDDRRTNLYKVYSALINLRNNYETFHASNFGLDVSGFMKKINLYHTSMDAFIVGNFGVTQSWTRPNFSRIGYWYDYFSGDSINVTDVTNLTDSIILAPGDFRIYTTSKLPLPEPGILLDVEQIENQIPVEYSLEQNYPNPFNPSTVIRYSIIKPAQVSLKIYDVLGSEIKTLVNKEQVNGVYEVTWNGDDQFGNKVSTGVYFYKINTGLYSETRKMMLIK